MDQTEKEKAKSLTQAFALSDLFGNCVEAINLIHGTHEDAHSEELLISQLGIQQARLLIWGDVVGICSPPAATGITSAVPQHPGAINPEPDKATYFGPRDIRLDDPRFRQRIEDALSVISNPMTHLSKTKMLQQYGLDLFRGSPNVRENHILSPNAFRLAAFREKFELLSEVTWSYPHASTIRNRGVDRKLAWSIQDVTKASQLAKLIREKVDYLVQLMDAQPRVDRSMKQDIRAMGWHPSSDMQATYRDTLKLSLLLEASETLYPEYSTAAQEAMDNITDQWKGSHGYLVQPDHLNPIIHKTASHTMLSQPLPQPESQAKHRGSSPGKHHHHHSSSKNPDKSKRGGLFGVLRPKLNRLFSAGKSGTLSPPQAPDPSRSRSESGPAGDFAVAGADNPQRSKSLANDDLSHVLTHTQTISSMISRHDQYPGLNKVPTIEHRNSA